MANGDDNSNGDGADVTPADVSVVLTAVTFPASRDDLVGAAEDADAADAIVVVLRDLPDQEYANQGEVDQAVEDRNSKK
jgi:hypothetical protein